MSVITALGVGSGLDLNGLLDKLEKSENQKLVPINTQQQSDKTKISALSKVKSDISGLQDAINKLTDAKSFHPVTSSVTGDALTAASTSKTPTGLYQIHVDQLATAFSQATEGVADKDTDLGAGSITYKVDGDDYSVAFDADHSSLTDIRDAINEENGPMRASIINDGDNFRLVLRSSETGEDAALGDIQFTGDAGNNLSLDGDTLQQAQNAELTINNIDIQSGSNVVQGAIQGVTLDLAQTGDATLQVTHDSSSVQDNIQDLVDKYNSALKGINELSKYDMDTQQAGILLGNGAVRQAKNGLRNAMAQFVDNNGQFNMLSDIGISMNVDGTLKVDDAALSKAVEDHPGDVQQLFIGDEDQPGLATQMSTFIDRVTGDNGSIASEIDSLNNHIDLLGKRHDRLQARIDATMDRYRKQFSRLDSTISSMNSTSQYLTQQFDRLANMGKQN